MGQPENFIVYFHVDKTCMPVVRTNFVWYHPNGSKAIKSNFDIICGGNYSVRLSDRKCYHAVVICQTVSIAQANEVMDFIANDIEPTEHSHDRLAQFCSGCDKNILCGSSIRESLELANGSTALHHAEGHIAVQSDQNTELKSPLQSNSKSFNQLRPAPVVSMVIADNDSRPRNSSIAAKVAPDPKSRSHLTDDCSYDDNVNKTGLHPPIKNHFYYNRTQAEKRSPSGKMRHQKLVKSPLKTYSSDYSEMTYKDKTFLFGRKSVFSAESQSHAARLAYHVSHETTLDDSNDSYISDQDYDNDNSDRVGNDNHVDQNSQDPYKFSNGSDEVSENIATIPLARTFATPRPQRDRSAATGQIVLKPHRKVTKIGPLKTASVNPKTPTQIPFRSSYIPSPVFDLYAGMSPREENRSAVTHLRYQIDQVSDNCQFLQTVLNNVSAVLDFNINEDGTISTTSNKDGDKEK